MDLSSFLVLFELFSFPFAGISGVFYMIIFSFFTVAQIEPLRGSFCLGEPAQWTCTANGSLEWKNQPNGIRSPVRVLYHDPDTYLRPEVPLSNIGPITTIVTCVRGTEYVSVARVNMELSLDGTKLWCSGSDNAFGAPEATVNLSVTGTIDPFM